MQTIKVYHPDSVRELLRYIATQHMSGAKEGFVSPQGRGALVGKLNEGIKQVQKSDLDAANEARHYLIGWLFGNIRNSFRPISIKKLENHHLCAIRRWIYGEVPEADENDKWTPRPAWIYELALLFYRVELCRDLSKGRERDYVLDQLIYMTKPVDDPQYTPVEPGSMTAQGILQGAVVTEVE